MVKKALLILFCLIVCVDVVIAIDPEIYFANQRAKNYEKSREFLLAAKIYAQLLEHDPLNHVYLHKTAENYEKAQEYDLAKLYYEKTLEYYVNDPIAQLGLAKMYLIEKNYPESAKLLNQVLQADPNNVKALVAYAQLYIAIYDFASARRVANKALSLDPESVSAYFALANSYASEGKFFKGFDVFQKAYVVTGDPIFENRILGFRPLVKPSLKAKSSVGQERERDLVLKITTTEINVWNHTYSLKLPVNDYFHMFTSFRYGQNQQKNLLQERNNYYFNILAYDLGVDIFPIPNWSVKMNSGFKWGEDRPGSIFPFNNQFVWQPLVSVKYSIPNFLIALTGFKDTFPGRNFDDDISYFIRYKILDLTTEIKYPRDYFAVGGQFQLGDYFGQFHNLKKVGSTWSRLTLVRDPFEMILEYLFRYGSFREVDQDYFSYRSRWENLGTFKLRKAWGVGGFVEGSYTINYQQLNDFVNVAEAIAEGSPPPEELRLNNMHGHTFIFKFKQVFFQRLYFEGKGLVYFDSNKYKTLAAELALEFLF